MNIYEIKDLETLLRTNEYPGRGIVVGKTPDGTKAVFCYFIMGRSNNSRNRVFELRGQDCYAKAFDESKVEDPSLIIYRAVANYGKKVIVTNGDQTDTIYDGLKAGLPFNVSLHKRTFEPDGPNWTPRISAILNFDDGYDYSMSILKSIDEEGSHSQRFFYDFEPINGLGHFIHTYEENGNPLPTFQGEPTRVRMNDDIDTFAERVWSSLNEQNKISLIVKYIDIKTMKEEVRLFNKNH